MNNKPKHNNKQQTNTNKQNNDKNTIMKTPQCLTKQRPQATQRQQANDTFNNNQQTTTNNNNNNNTDNKQATQRSPTTQGPQTINTTTMKSKG